MRQVTLLEYYNTACLQHHKQFTTKIISFARNLKGMKLNQNILGPALKTGLKIWYVVVKQTQGFVGKLWSVFGDKKRFAGDYWSIAGGVEVLRTLCGG